ncbi:uncharacterized protein LOC106157154 isoform X1 [Lingula anatina]|uniref:Uncharacterized protein LOC106157154 isoform X1 n=1 Tax=Lingula anatina TaxID=7574 RepID=A0A1S3HSU6_LINAN|nr:uncharacterized protein LOC106157154 isoform X1 [Lingula anatina]|eukprot:XP_013388129.1 uncharacterized protein LOC106157154 isoform X1 [Lingula anatina]
MFSLYVVLAAGLVTVAIGQANPDRWSPSDYPNPRMPNSGSYSCLRKQKKSYICDPNTLISFEDANMLDKDLERIANNSRCLCSASECNRRQQNKEPRGTRMAVALMQEMKREVDGEDSDEKRIGDAQSFAHRLYPNWNLGGECHDVVLLIYSKHENVLYVATGPAASQVVSNMDLNRILADSRQYFSSGNDENSRRKLKEGLQRLINDFKTAFIRGQYIPRKWHGGRSEYSPGSAGQSGRRSSAFMNTFSGLLTMTALFISFLVIY